MTRAVIELSGDISPAMPRMSKLIEGCAYSPEAPGLSFRVKDIRVVVERNKIDIYNVENEATAKAVTDWLINLINGKVMK